MAAFSVKEMLAVVAVISVLLCVQLSALTSGADTAKIAQCAANLKQFAGCAANLMLKLTITSFRD